MRKNIIVLLAAGLLFFSNHGQAPSIEQALARGHAICIGAGFPEGNERAACVASSVQAEMTRAANVDPNPLYTLLRTSGIALGAFLLLMRPLFETTTK